jgi:hypothetical protein
MINQVITSFCNWLSNTQLSAWEGGQDWLIPVSQSVHIICVSLLVGTIGRLDLRLLGVFGTNQAVSEMTRRYVPWMWRLLLVLLFTGILQTIAEPTRELMNPSFRWKMFLLAVVLLSTWWLVEQLKTKSVQWDSLPVSGASRLVGGVSIFCWVVIVLLGRWIAYTQ